MRAHPGQDSRDQQPEQFEHALSIADLRRARICRPTGDFDGAYAAAPVKIDQTYRTPAFNNNPMEMHATIANWEGDHLTLYDANQGSSVIRDIVAEAFGLGAENVHVISHHIGGGFGKKAPFAQIQWSRQWPRAQSADR